MTLLPYWQAGDWRHPVSDPFTPGRHVATIAGVPTYATWGALIYPVMIVAAMAAGVVARGPYAALAAGFGASIVLGVVPHEMAHGFVARRAAQTVGSARIWLGGAAVVWGAAGEVITPRDLALVAAAGPLTNLGLAGGSLLAAEVTQGGVRGFFVPLSLFNAVFFVSNALPVRARRKPGQRRIGTDGAIVARALHAARRGPSQVDMLSPAVPPLKGPTMSAGGVHE
ncbi:MAG: hypothetical protein QOF30_3247 [Acidimicrobiaceae bacterium]|jgi:hypothetical protein|nr:hypothetical protein [Acidimicrobiaceae bacterium]